MMKRVFIGLGLVCITMVTTLTLIYQRYIYHYNRGNDFYEEGQYDKAVDEYEKALNCRLAEGKECDIRVNMALAMVAPLDIKNPEKLSEKERKKYIKILEGAVEILTEEGCAGKKKGHDEDAQQLKEELEEILDELEQEQEQTDPDESDPEDGDDKDTPGRQEQTREQQKQLEDILQQGTEEHIKTMEEYKQMEDYKYYGGKSW